MKKQHLKGIFCGLAIAAGLICVNPITGYAAELEDADISAGVTTYEENGSKYLNLNGNSVVIKESAASTDENPMVNLYIDTNRNGVADADEEMVAVGDIKDFGREYTITGINNAKSVTPISITMESGTVSALYVLRNGELHSDNAEVPAVNVDIRGGQVYNFIVAEHSSITGVSGKNAVDVSVTGSPKINTLQILANNTTQSDEIMSVKGNVSVDVACNKSDEIQNIMTFCGINNKYDIDGDIMYSFATVRLSAMNYFLSGASHTTGSVEVALNDVEISSLGYLIYDSSVDGSINFKAEKGTLINSSASLVRGSIVGGNLNVEFDKLSSSYYFTAADTSRIEGNVVVKHNGVSGSYGYGLYAVTGCMSESEYAVKGDVELTVLGGIYSEIYAVNNTKINGNVKLNLNVCTAQMVYGANSSVIGRDLMVNAPEKAYVEVKGSIYGAYSSNIAGDLNIDYSSDLTENTHYFYGIYSSYVAGDANISVSKGRYQTLSGTDYCSSDAYGVGGNCKIEIRDAVATGNIYGAYNINVGGNCDVDIINSGNENTSGYANISGAENVKISGTLSVDITGCIANSLRGIHYGKANIGNNEIEGKACTVNITDCISAYSFYGLYSSDINGDVEIIMERCSGSDNDGIYGLNYSDINGNVDVTINESHAGGIYSSYYTKISGDFNFTANGGSYGRGAESVLEIYPYCISSGDTKTSSNVKAVLKGVDFSNCKSLNVIGYLREGNRASLTIDDECTLPDTYSIQADRTGNGYAVASFNGDYYIAGKAVIDENISAKNIYIGNKIEYSYVPADIVIPQGIALTAEENVYIPICATVTLEGTINGNLVDIGQDGTSSSQAYGAVFVNGGTVNGTITNVDVFYPVNYIYNDKGGSIAHLLNTRENGGKRYGKSGAAIETGLTINEGYQLNSSVWQQGDEVYELAVSNSTYSFDMPQSPVTIKFDITGKKLVAGKTVSDPVAKLGTSYTAEKPLYNFDSIVLANDARTGEVSYELLSGNTLPEGLLFADGVIYGTPSKAYETGKKVTFKITGRNEAVINVTLNIIVTSGEAQQTDQTGRIISDEAAKEINLLGNSVVIDTYENSQGEAVTGIYIDENRDGNADSNTPAYTGDLSEFTVYGVKDADTSRPVKITLKNGTVNELYGAYNANVTAPGQDAVHVDVQGGHVNDMYMLVDSNADGYIRIEYNSEYIDGNSKVNNSTYKGYYLDKSGAITIYGEYTLREEINASSMNIYKSSDNISKITVEKPVTLTGIFNVNANGNVVLKDTLTAEGIFAGNNAVMVCEKDVRLADSININSYADLTFKAKLEAEGNMKTSSYSKLTLNGETKVADLSLQYMTDLYIEENAKLSCVNAKFPGSNTEVYHKGEFTATGSIENTTRWFMMNGTFGEGFDSSTISAKYYPAVVKTDFEKVSLSLDANKAYTVDDVQYITPATPDNAIKYTVVPGYEAYMTINGGQAVLMDTAPYKFQTLDEPVEIVVDYVPTNINVSKKYADPVITVGTEYTASNPVYDLRTLSIKNDTTSVYGGDVLYALKNGQSLPEGLSFADGRIIGTPVAANGDSEAVKFVVTGRNGTTAVAELNITINEDGTGTSDINDKASVSGNKISINGSSVVILSDVNDANKCGIYMDENHDGIADNNHALLINGAAAYDLSSYIIYGYKDTENAYDGDISIYVRGGKIGTVYGVYGTGAYNKAILNGKIDLFLDGGFVGNACAAYNANVSEAGFYVRGAEIGSDIYGINNVEVNNYNFEFSGASVANKSSYVAQSGKLYAAYKSTILNDANLTVGADENTNPFGTSATSYWGLNSCNINGNVNYVIDGKWYTGSRGLNTLVSSSNISGIMNVDWRNGTFGSNYADTTNVLNASILRQSNVNDVNITVSESAKINVDVFNILVGGSANNVKCVVPEADSIRILSFNIYSTNSIPDIKGVAYTYNEGDVSIDGKGEYTITEDMDIKNLNIAAGTSVTIAEGVNVNISANATISGILNNKGTVTTKYDTVVSGTINNSGAWNCNYRMTLKGTFDNTGVFDNTSSSYVLSMTTGSVFINREAGTYNMGVISNSGKIVNYGRLVYSKSSSAIGKIYTTTMPEFTYAASRYTTIYYLTYIDDDYPKYCVDTLEITASAGNIVTGPIEGDTNTYIKAGVAFNVKVGNLLEGIAVEKITYGSNNKSATVSADNINYQGSMGYEPTVIKVSFTNTDTETESIVLDKTEDEVNTLRVGQTTTLSNPVYDMTNIVVSNDDDTISNSYVTYQIGVASSLPKGLVLRNGKIYGTPTEASETPYETDIIVKGKNQTYAVFKLKFTSVAKGVPVFNLPDNLVANKGDTLASITLPYNSRGTFSWPDASLSVGDVSADGNEFDIIFTPYDTVNYDWSLIDSSKGTFEDGVVKAKVRVKIRKLVPEYTLPDGVTAVYGQTLADVIIPEGANGHFEWEDNTLSVGDAGKHDFAARYIPNDTATYDNVENIMITVDVKPQPVIYTPALTTVAAKNGQSLAEIQLPDADSGKYQWITQTTTVAEDGKSYKVGFKPDDTTNYDWTNVTGWSNAYKAVVFEVVISVTHVHEYAQEWVSDDTNHWHECECGEKTDLAAHTWDSGVVTKASSAGVSGIKTFTCTICNKTKTEVLPAAVVDITKPESKLTVSGISNKNYTGKAQTQSSLVVKSGNKTLVSGKDYTVAYKNNVKVGRAVVTITGKGAYKGSVNKSFNITLSKGKIYVVKNMKYKITKVGNSGKGTVSLVGTKYKNNNKRFKKLNVGSTVNIGGVKYKITEIGNNAFKKYKNLKTLTVGSNVKKIGKNAFYGCKNLKTITIKTTKLTKKSIGSKAFTGTHKKPTVKVPKKKYKTYKAILKSKGISKNVKYKKG